jgi:hypothetical protein
MASEVDICNLALGHLGDQATVASINPPESSVQAEACKKFYPVARDVALEAHPWNFAVRRTTPAAITNSVDSWRYAYQVPNGIIRPIAVLLPSSSDDDQTQDYVIESLDTGDLVLYTNVDTPTLKYIARVTDTTKFSPMFVSALSWLLASYLAGPVLRGKVGAAAKSACEKRYIAELAMAAASNGNARRVSTYRNHRPQWIGARSFQQDTDTSWPIRS